MADRFSGQQTHNMDAKGRITIPAKYRDQLGIKVTVTEGRNRNLELYSLNEWERVSGKYAAIERDAPKEVYDDMVDFLSSAEDGNEVDKQGRLLVPPRLRELVDLNKEVVLTGAGNHLEVWAKAEWDKYQERRSRGKE